MGVIMSLTKGKKAAFAGFAIFLIFMAVCTVTAKGIYRSGLAKVTTQTPYGSSLVHEIKARGTVKQGQEYGVYTESGLRVSAVAVRKGEYFDSGAPLFQVDMSDLHSIIAAKELEIQKLKILWEEQVQGEQKTDRERRTAVVRSREDYENILRETDGRIENCRQALEGAAQELALYDQYLAKISQGGSVSGSDTENSQNGYLASGDMGSEGAAQLEYGQQEKRLQLLQNLTSCRQALEEAERSKETTLQAASRAIEDAENGLEVLSAGGAEELDIAYREKELYRLKELAEKDGWIYSEAPGRVTECRVAVGERTQDGAGILYAQDNGKKVIEAVFEKEYGRYLTQNTEFSLNAVLPGGSPASDTVVMNYMEVSEDGKIYTEMSPGSLDLCIGQNVELSYRGQTERFSTCIPAECIHGEEQGGYYVYVAEEREGILGTEWKVRKVFVTILDRTDSVAAVESAEIGGDTRIVTTSSKELADGDTVRTL